MSDTSPDRSARRLLRKVLSAMAGGPQVLAFLPALTLAAYWLGGEPYLLATTILVPALFAAGGLFTRSFAGAGLPPPGSDGLPGRTSAVARAEAILEVSGATSSNLAVLAIRIDDAREIEDRLGPAAFREVVARTGDRIAACVRASDLLAHLGDATFALVLASPRTSDLETLLQLSSRVQAGVAEPLSVGGARIYVSVSVGFARPDRAMLASGEALVAAAESALAEAAAHGPGSVRGHARRSPARAAAPEGNAAEIAEALAAGQIAPWFQPQVLADTGALSGAEALARWMHPTRGLLLPSEFLPTAEAAGLSERLGASILHASLAAIRDFDAKGHHIPHLSVNFAPAELRNPGIVDRVRWELDRFGLSSDRLTVEVLETVIEETGDDVVTRSLGGLAALGCGIDLDDFGTGHAAIGSIRRFSVQRVKIDRSFVRRIDTDPDQQTIVSAMILMADRLGVDTLAEGVETAAEQAALARLGCRHVQGFAVARPMPETAFLHWLSARPEVTSVIPRPGTAASAGPAGKTA